MASTTAAGGGPGGGAVLSRRGGDGTKAAPPGVLSEGGSVASAGGTGAVTVQNGGPASGGAATVAVQDGGPASGGGGSGQAVGGAAQGCGWVRKNRLGAIPDERVPQAGRVSAYEQSLRNYAEKKSAIVINPAVGTSFDSRAETFDFYNLYSWEVGFGIRWGKNAKNSGNSITRQEIVCCCSGKRQKAYSASMQTSCKAMVRLFRSSDNGWYIKEFRPDHNHDLSGACIERSIWPCHKYLDPYTKDLVLHLRNNNIDLSKINCIIASFFGTMGNVLFNKRALKSLCTKISNEHSDGDVGKTLELFHSMRRDDPSFMYSVEVDDESRIKTILWTNGRSRMQYAHFGDAITFDTTFRTTLYDIPFGIFVSTNNHYQSLIFGGVVMRHETEESFKWVFHEFVTLMGGRSPSTILTDQRHEMELAIREVLPGSTHRMCKLHALSRENECLGPIYLNKSGLKDDFHKIINGMLTVSEFESAWQCLLDEYDLHGNEFLSQIYDSRFKWAKLYFKEKFCGKQTSTQRSETGDDIIKGYVPPDSSISMFVQQYNNLQFILDSKESFEENRNKRKPREKKGVPIEEHAANTYTRAMFEKFGETIFESGSYVVDEKEKGKAYLVRYIRSDRQERWSQLEFHVTIRAEDGAVVYECGLGEHMGMPCCHAVKVMIHLGMQEIPAGNIMKRWTRNARDISTDHLTEHEDNMTLGMSRALKYAALYVAAMEAVNLGVSSKHTFETALVGLTQVKQQVLEASRIKGNVRSVEQPCPSAAHGSETSSDMQDVSAVTMDDATSAGQEPSSEVKVLGCKRKLPSHLQGEETQ